MKVGIIYGSFNKIHLGHLKLCAEAKQYCDKLIVWMEQPETIRLNKGYPNDLKPLKSLRSKLEEFLRHQPGVDYIIVNPEVIDYSSDEIQQYHLECATKISPDIIFIAPRKRI